MTLILTFLRKIAFSHFVAAGGIGFHKNSYFYVPGSNDREHIVFVLSDCLFVCLFVCLLSTLTFAITFEPYEIQASYLACILK